MLPLQEFPALGGDSKIPFPPFSEISVPGRLHRVSALSTNMTPNTKEESR
jgi:hypothetical protein